MLMLPRVAPLYLKQTIVSSEVPLQQGRLVVYLTARFPLLPASLLWSPLSSYLLLPLKEGS